MTEKQLNIADRLLHKSTEAFILGIEIYNKPTIQYRVEGFSFFICNAWELMLKSHMIKSMGENSIYFPDNPERTISLENCIKRVFTNNKDPLRLNLEKIIELRNISTHYVTEEYEMIYIPLFQSCVINFSEKIEEFHGFDITTLIPQNFLTLNVSMQAIEDYSIRAKYPEEIANKLISVNEEITKLSSVRSQKFAIKIEHHHYLVRDRSKATSLIGIDNNADAKVKIIKELKDPNLTHPYNMKGIIDAVNKQLQKSNINLINHNVKDGKDPFNKYVFQLIVNYCDLKMNPQYCYTYKTGKSTFYNYSQQTIEFIINEIKSDPENIIENLKERIKER